MSNLTKSIGVVVGAILVITAPILLGIFASTVFVYVFIGLTILGAVSWIFFCVIIVKDYYDDMDEMQRDFENAKDNQEWFKVWEKWSR